ncbi:septal ring lytic transglycosylase RlpA family protein [Flavobacterium sp.]|uniref:septal ring lytic transglycosylase RlpA family protein n=1 Tax=Flavobacterium sp. TaxID=239 RepID=UPI003F6A0E1F
MKSLIHFSLLLAGFYYGSQITNHHFSAGSKHNFKSFNDTIIVDSTDFKMILVKDIAHASYYHDKFTGKKTASGKIFNNNELTCAHKSLPFGTILRVTSIKTNKSVDVTVTDRGPFVKGRDIDLSKKAFMNIAPNKYAGSIKVKLEKFPDN